MRKATIGLALASIMGVAAEAAPDRLSYQGVLRNAGGAAINGSYDMVFRFFDAAAAGNEILVDRHENAGTGDVFVSNGLFQVELGSGAISDGAAVLPGDPYMTLGAVFEDFNNVWMEIQVGQNGGYETLSPRTHVVSAPYALRAASAESADSVGGLPSGNIITTSATAQTKAGALQVDGTLTAGGSLIGFGNGGTLESNVSRMIITGGNANSDDLYLRGGNSAADGGIEILGAGPINVRSGSGNVNFLNDVTSAVTATLDATGTFTTAGNLITQGLDHIFFNGGKITGASSGLIMTGGPGSSDSLTLQKSAISETRIFMEPSGGIDIISSGPPIVFRGAGSSLRASMDSFGNLTAGGDVTVSGNDLYFGVGALIAANTTEMHIFGGVVPDSDIYIRAGDGSGDGRIELFGDGAINIRPGNGQLNIFNDETGATAATLTPSGLELEGDVTVHGGNVIVGPAGTPSELSASTNSVSLRGGSGPGARATVRAGSTNCDYISIDYQDNLHLSSCVGDVTFGTVSRGGIGGAINATLTADGRFSVAEDLVALGNEVHLGTPGSTRMVRNPAADDLYFARDEDQNHSFSTFSIFTNIGVMQMRINDGDEAPAFFDGAVNINGIDYAEAFQIRDPTLQAAEVVLFDTTSPGYIRRADEAYSTLIAGVISENPGVVTGNSFNAEEAADPVLAEEMHAAYAANNYDRAKQISLILEQKKNEKQRPVALAGRLPVKVDASYGPIKPGDHLTSSKTPGHAMAMQEPGPSLGVALEGWDGPGPGIVMAFVQRGHYTPPALLAQAAATQQSLATSLAARTPDPVSGVQMIPANLQVVLDAQGGEEARFSIFRDGSPSEPRAEMFRVDEKGNVWAQGAFRPRAMDLAEVFAVSEPVEPGDVLVADRKNPGFYARSTLSGDPAVVGVVASDPGVLLGADMSRLLAAEPDLSTQLAEARAAGDRLTERDVWAELEKRFHATHAAVALSGTLKVKVDADYGAIEPGDLLIASPTPGHAMRAPDPAPQGAVIGKALESFDAGAGIIRMVVWTH